MRDHAHACAMHSYEVRLCKIMHPLPLYNNHRCSQRTLPITVQKSKRAQLTNTIHSYAAIIAEVGDV